MCESEVEDAGPLISADDDVRRFEITVGDPASMGGGFPCFFASLVYIGILTALIGDLAALFGCFCGVKDSVTAITFVALLSADPADRQNSVPKRMKIRHTPGLLADRRPPARGPAATQMG